MAGRNPQKLKIMKTNLLNFKTLLMMALSFALITSCSPDDGEDGAQGPQGEQGVTGPQGPPGEQGDQVEPGTANGLHSAL